MISKSNIKLIKSLANKKQRQKEKLFLVEGDKNVLEVLKSKFIAKHLFATHEFLLKNKEDVHKALQTDEASADEIRKASLLKNPQNSLVVCKTPENVELPEKISPNLSLFLDGIQDPGNLGTIIRICDWFGIDQLFCSPDTTDFYSPKVIQASMGSFLRVNVWYTPFEMVAQLASTENTPIFGALLNGENVYSKKLPKQALLVVGNEGNGIRNSVEQIVTNKIRIPSYANESNGAESLNVAIATGIICAEFKRQKWM